MGLTYYNHRYYPNHDLRKLYIYVIIDKRKRSFKQQNYKKLIFGFCLEVASYLKNQFPYILKKLFIRKLDWVKNGFWRNKNQKLFQKPETINLAIAGNLLGSNYYNISHNFTSK